MAILRKFANKTLDVVERNVSAHSSPWVRAMRGEMDCIASDWQALRWALGSVRILLRPSRKAELPPLDEMSSATNKLIDQLDSKKRMALIWTGTSLLFFNSTHQRSWLWAGLALFHLTLWIQIHRMKIDKISVATDPASEGEQYRQVLSFLHQMLGGTWFWLRAVVVLAGGLLQAHQSWKAGSHEYAMTVLGGMFALGLFVSFMARKQRAQAEQKLDALDAERKSKGL